MPANEGAFPGVVEISPELQDAIDTIAENVGVEVRQRCCMPEMARATVCGWRHKPVTASIKGSLPGLTDVQVVQVYQKCLTIWNQSCNVGLTWTDDFDNANIWARACEIDGASGTLAWSYLPPCGGTTNTLRLEQRYDTSESWRLAWAQEVMLHELGHAIGLDHINNKNALMNPYSAGGAILAPTQYELDIVVPLYGPPVVDQPSPIIPVIQGGVLFISGTSVAVHGNSFIWNNKQYTLKVVA